MLVKIRMSTDFAFSKYKIRNFFTDGINYSKHFEFSRVSKFEQVNPRLSIEKLESNFYIENDIWKHE